MAGNRAAARVTTMNDIEKSTQPAYNHQSGRRGRLPISLAFLMTLSALTSMAVFILSLIWLAGYSFVIIPVSWFLTVLHHGTLITTHLVHVRRQNKKQAQEQNGEPVVAASLIASTPASAITTSANLTPSASAGFSVTMEVKPAVSSVQAPLKDPQGNMGIGDRAEPTETGAPTYQDHLPLSSSPIDHQSSYSSNLTSTNRNNAYPSSVSPNPPSNTANDTSSSKVPTITDLHTNMISSAVIHPANIITTCLLATLWSAASWLPIGTAIIFDPQWPGSRVFPVLQGALGYLEAAVMWMMFAVCLYWRFQEKKAGRE